MPPKSPRKMIGKSLQERHGLGTLDAERAVAILTEVLRSHAKPIVDVRAKGSRMIACVVADAHEASVRLCRGLGFELRPGGMGVFGVLGDDAVRLFPNLSEANTAWLTAPCGPRETKVLLMAGGSTALLSLEANEGKLTITPR